MVYGFMVYGRWLIIDSLWFMVYGLWLMVHSNWIMIYDLWFMIDGIWYTVYGLRFTVYLRGSRPVLSCENGREGVSVKILRPTDRSRNFGRIKLLSDSETVGRAKKNGRTKSIIHHFR
jgi:hypothetical protein